MKLQNEPRGGPSGLWIFPRPGWGSELFILKFDQTGIQTTHHPHPPVFCGLDQNFLKDTPQFYSFSSVVHAEFCWNCRFFPQPCMYGGSESDSQFTHPHPPPTHPA